MSELAAGTHSPQSAAGGQAHVHDLARAMAGRVAGLIRPLADTAIPVPRSEWTVGETAAHLAFAKGLMSRMVAGEAITYSDGTREGLARENMESLIGFAERDGAVLAGMIEESVADFCRNAKTRPADAVINGPIGPMPLEVFDAYLLTHLMMHGEAIARALRKPSILDRQSIVSGAPFMFFAIEHFVDHDAVKGFTGSFELRLRGGPRFYVRFNDGVGQFSPTPLGRVDCHLSADPVAFFRVGIRLVDQWGPIAAGKLTTWGRKPWLAFRFAGIFLPP